MIGRQFIGESPLMREIAFNFLAVGGGERDAIDDDF